MCWDIFNGSLVAFLCSRCFHLMPSWYNKLVTAISCRKLNIYGSTEFKFQIGASALDTKWGKVFIKPLLSNCTWDISAGFHFSTNCKSWVHIRRSGLSLRLTPYTHYVHSHHLFFSVLPSIRAKQADVNATADIGSSAMLACEADGFPEPTVTWTQYVILCCQGLRHPAFLSFKEE